MILEERMLEIISQLPQRNGFKPVYHFGDELELNKFILKSKKSVYPLIWQIVKPEKDNAISKRITTDLEFFIAVQNKKTAMFNTERWETSYKNVLIPVYEDFKKAFIECGIIQSDFSFDIQKMPNYSQTEIRDKSKTIDIIDAILVKLPNSTIIDTCIKNVKF